MSKERKKASELLLRYKSNAYELGELVKIPWKYNEKILDPLVEKLLEREIDFPEIREVEMRRVIMESLLNSIGACGEREEKCIRLSVWLRKGKVICFIRDDGPGFDHRNEITGRRKEIDEGKYSRETLEEDIPNPSFIGGAGLASLLLYPTRFKYNEGGNKLYVEFDLSQ